MTSQGAFTLGSRLSPGSMATVQKRAPGQGAGTALQAAANSKLCGCYTTAVAAQLFLTHPHCSLTWTDVTRDAGAHAHADLLWSAHAHTCARRCVYTQVPATCAHHHSLASYNETREKPGAERVDQ